MPSSVQTKPSTDERVREVLSGKPHFMDIYYFIKHNPGGIKCRTIADSDAVDRHYTKVSGYLNEMEDLNVVTFKRDGRTKYWDLPADLRVLVEDDQPTVIERTVEMEIEVPRQYESITAYLREHSPLFNLLGGGVLFGVLLHVAVFIDLLPTVFIHSASLVLVSAVVGAVVMVAMAVQAVGAMPFGAKGSGGAD